MMNIKKILVLLLFTIAIIGIIAPANAKLNCEVESESTWGGKTSLYLYVYSDIGMNSKNEGSTKYVSARKTELNTVNKIDVSIKGYNTLTFKKPAKGWNINNHYFNKGFSVKGNAFYKSCTIKLYDKKGKLIKNKKDKVKYYSETD